MRMIMCRNRLKIVLLTALFILTSCGSEAEYKFIEIVPHTVYEFSFAESNDTELTPRMVAFLDILIVEIQNNTEYKLTIYGHSDGKGTEEINTNRAMQRAENALSYLKLKGLSPDRVELINKSNSEPITNNPDEKSQALNRRIGFKLTY
jgi:outer membrane protein OmpA-like peptidoglycan-associated protein